MTTIARIGGLVVSMAVALILVPGPALADDIDIANYGIAMNGMPFAVALSKGYLKDEGAGSITGTVIGAILLSVISNILNLTSIISVYLNAAVQGFVIIIVAFLQRGRR